MAMPPASASPTDPTDPMAAGAGAPPDADSDTDSGTTVCTIERNADGSYTVYAGDEPDDDSAGMSEDDDAAMGGGDQGMGAGAPPAAPEGQHADSIGQALKFALDILSADAQSAGGQGSPDDQFASGFNENAAPKPVPPKRR